MYKIISYIILIFIFSACSNKNASYSWQRTKAAGYNAVTDTMTWAPLATGLVMDATNYDEDITNHIMKENEEDRIFTEEEADNLRTLSTTITYTSAVLIEDNNLTLKAKRVLVESAALYTGKVYVKTTNSHIEHESPSGNNNDAFGSNHAVTPFASAALTRRNLQQMKIPTWSKYSVNTLSYLSASGSAYQRIESGLHSFSDQMYSIAIGNFIALFIHDAFLSKDADLGIDMSQKNPKITMNFQF